MPVSDIADKLLYCCRAWFCSAFRRVNGETPLQYRRKEIPGVTGQTV